jgi:hypothetical protein
MASKAPPIPAEQRARPDDKPDVQGGKGRPSGDAAMNLKEQGQPGNISQNTHHQGYQQDR